MGQYFGTSQNGIDDKQSGTKGVYLYLYCCCEFFGVFRGNEGKLFNSDLYFQDIFNKYDFAKCLNFMLCIAYWFILDLCMVIYLFIFSFVDL